MKILVMLFVLSSTLAQPQSPPANVKPELNLKALAQPLQELTSQDRKVVDEAVRLIDHSQHAAALATLTRLTKNNSQNAGLHVLRAYVLLELGNATGALKDAKVAENTGGQSAYKCWFLAQVAYLAGNKPLCHREINHVHADPTYGPDADRLAPGFGQQRKVSVCKFI